MIRHVGSNMETVRRNNRAAILNYINTNGPVSRKDLAAIIGLTPAAVTQICTDLLSERILVEVGTNAESQRAGRKKILLDINYDVAYVFSINIESEFTTVALSNLKGDMVELERCHTDTKHSPEEFLIRMGKLCLEMLEHYPELSEDVVAVGVGVPGLVNAKEGISEKAYGIWDEAVDVKTVLGKVLAYPVFVENNVNALARAELLFGIGKDQNHLMVIKWGPGVGCAMIIDQDVYEGRRNRAAELGHFIVDPDGELCSCGRRGCLETKVSYQALNQIRSFDELEFEEAYLAAEKDGCAEPFEEAIDIFARSIVNSATIMAPHLIVITGSLFRGQIIRRKIMDACVKYDPSLVDGRILYSILSERESYIGPVATCAKHLLF